MDRNSALVVGAALVASASVAITQLLRPIPGQDATGATNMILNFAQVILLAWLAANRGGNYPPPTPPTPLHPR